MKNLPAVGSFQIDNR